MQNSYSCYPRLNRKPGQKENEKLATARETMRNVQHIHTIKGCTARLILYLFICSHPFYQVDEMKGAKLKSCGQKNLADDGTRDWDDGLRFWLDKEYPGWKDPQRTYMVPPSFESKGNEPKWEGAEKTMYDNLQELGLKNNEPMFVVHSFDFSEHVPGSGRKRSWVMGESDFVVIHRNHGPIFFQVKATETGDKYKEAEEQIRKDKLALETFFKKLEKGVVEDKISARKVTEVLKNCPGFVVMPNCQRGQSVCTQDNALYQEDCSSSEAFSIWWEEKIGRSQHPPLDQTVFEHLVMW